MIDDLARRRSALAVAALATLAACSSQPVPAPGVPGAGVQTAIVGVDHDPTGYTVRFTMTNLDTADVGYGACTGAVEVPSDTGWTSVTHRGQCQLWLGILPPTRSVTLSIPQQALTQGSQIRVALGWSFVASRGGAGLSTSDPVVVP